MATETKLTVTSNESDAVSPPSGAGLNTVTAAVRADAMSLAGMVAVSWVLLTSVVVRSAPSHRTTDEATKLVPSTVRVNSAPPAAVLSGEIDVNVGTGLVSTQSDVTVTPLASSAATSAQFTFVEVRRTSSPAPSPMLSSRG